MTAGADRGQGNARRALVTAQVALALVLAVAAGLLIRSSHDVSGEPWLRDPPARHRRRSVWRTGAATSARRGPRSSRFASTRPRSLGSKTPRSPTRCRSGVGAARDRLTGQRREFDVIQQVVGPRYFETVRQPLLRGRSLGLATRRRLRWSPSSIKSSAQILAGLGSGRSSARSRSLASASPVERRSWE